MILMYFFSLYLFFYFCGCNPYSWELTFCGTNSNGYKVYSNIYFIPLASLYELSLLPLRSIGSFAIFVSDGPTPLVCPLFSFSFEVFSFKVRARGSY
jgi:hypothetical protein